MRKHYGRFIISHRIIEDYPKAVIKLFKGMLVVHCESLYAYNSIEYVAHYSQFLAVPQGAMVPEYHITFLAGRHAPVRATFSHDNGEYSFEKGLVV